MSETLTPPPDIFFVAAESLRIHGFFDGSVSCDDIQSLFPLIATEMVQSISVAGMQLHVTKPPKTVITTPGPDELKTYAEVHIRPGFLPQSLKTILRGTVINANGILIFADDYTVTPQPGFLQKGIVSRYDIAAIAAPAASQLMPAMLTALNIKLEPYKAFCTSFNSVKIEEYSVHFNLSGRPLT